MEPVLEPSCSGSQRFGKAEDGNQTRVVEKVLGLYYILQNKERGMGPCPSQALLSPHARRCEHACLEYANCDLEHFPCMLYAYEAAPIVASIVACLLALHFLSLPRPLASKQ
jgi:hypothetical protein